MLQVTFTIWPKKFSLKDIGTKKICIVWQILRYFPCDNYLSYYILVNLGCGEILVWYLKAGGYCAVLAWSAWYHTQNTRQWLRGTQSRWARPVPRQSCSELFFSRVSVNRYSFRRPFSNFIKRFLILIYVRPFRKEMMNFDRFLIDYRFMIGPSRSTKFLE